MEDPKAKAGFNRKTGEIGEQIALSFVRRKGLEVIARNWRNGRYGEIDIIAYHPSQKLLIFIEVKTRKNTLYGAPIEAVTAKKQTQLMSLSEAFVNAYSQYQDSDRRFDVIGIYFSDNGKPADILHIENAFEG